MKLESERELELAIEVLDIFIDKEIKTKSDEKKIEMLGDAIEEYESKLELIPELTLENLEKFQKEMNSDDPIFEELRKEI